MAGARIQGQAAREQCLWCQNTWREQGKQNSFLKATDKKNQEQNHAPYLDASPGLSVEEGCRPWWPIVQHAVTAIVTKWTHARQQNMQFLKRFVMNQNIRLKRFVINHCNVLQQYATVNPHLPELNTSYSFKLISLDTPWSPPPPPPPKHKIQSVSFKTNYCQRHHSQLACRQFTVRNVMHVKWRKTEKNVLLTT